MSGRMRRRRLGGTHVPKDNGHGHSLSIDTTLFFLPLCPLGEGLVGDTVVGELDCLDEGHSMVIHLELGRGGTVWRRREVR